MTPENKAPGTADRFEAAFENMGDRDFYIGYVPKMPSGAVRSVRAVLGVLLLAAALFGVIFVFGQRPFANSVFEYGKIRDFEGTVQARPIPFLIVEHEGEINGLPAFERIPLVAEGKSGAFEAVNDFDAKHVSLKGTLIHRRGQQMIEVASGSVRKDEGLAARPEDDAESLGKMSLRGEIIDSKCYLGVMNPGNHKTHRSCAVACIRGGIPPMFLVKDAKGNASELWLLSEEGVPVNEQVLDYIAEPVEISGEAVRRGNQLFFYFDPALIKRIK